MPSTLLFHSPLAARLRPAAFAGMLLACALTQGQPVQASGAPAGTVVLAAGPVFLLHNGTRQPLQRGSAIVPGQAIITGEGGFAHVRMADGGLVAVRPFSRFELEVFDYRQDQATDRVRYRLDEGVARAITGGVGEANKEAFRLNTPVAAVGVRGTDFVVATSPTASRVAINSGAVVVAALGEHCTASGFGSCAQGGVVLGKGNSLPGQFVEVVRGEQLPRMVQDPAQTPDRLTPPHEAEPPTAQADRLPDPRVAESGVTVERPDNRVPEPVMPAPEPPPPAASVAMPNNVHWGRWSNSATLDETSVTRVATLVQAGQPIHVVNSHYGAGLSQRATQLPQQGRVDFVAAGGEAVLASAAGNVPLQVADGRLGVNFDQRSFTTEARFTGENQQYLTQAAGRITDNGYLQSSPELSNARVTGALAESLDSAITTVEQQFDEGQLSGVVVWGRP